MDGGRVLRALLARSRPHAQATRTAARVGVWFAVLFAVVGVFANPILILLALFVYGAAKTESRITVLADLLEGFTAGDLTDADLPRVGADTSVAAFGDRMLADRETTYLVTEDGSVVGVATLADLRRVRRPDRESTTVGEIARRDLATVAATVPAFDAVALFGGRDAPYVLVERDGEVVGVVGEESVGHVLALRESGLEAGREMQPF